MHKTNQIRLAIAAGEICSVVGMIADELRLLICGTEEVADSGRINLIDALLEELPSRFSYDPEERNEEWQVHGDTMLWNGHLTACEVDWVLDAVRDAIRAAALVRELRSSDAHEFFNSLSNVKSHADDLLADSESARARNLFVGFMEAVPR